MLTDTQFKSKKHIDGLREILKSYGVETIEYRNIFANVIHAVCRLCNTIIMMQG